jgi:hypothetical protein
MEGDLAPRRRRNRLVLALATAAVVLVTLVAAGERVPLATESGEGAHLTTRPSPPAPVEVTQQPAARVQNEGKIPGAGAIAIAFQAFLIVFGLAFLVAGVWEIVRVWSRRDEPEDEPDPPEPARDVRPEEIVEVLDEGLGAMGSGPVDDVVIACWVRLERAAAAAGVDRLASETPAELAARVLGELHAPAPAVERLLVRYRTARFSDHRLDDDDRAVAVRALEEIRVAIAGARA